MAIYHHLMTQFIRMGAQKRSKWKWVFFLAFFAPRQTFRRIPTRVWNKEKSRNEAAFEAISPSLERHLNTFLFGVCFSGGCAAYENKITFFVPKIIIINRQMPPPSSHYNQLSSHFQFGIDFAALLCGVCSVLHRTAEHSIRIDVISGK